MHNALLAVVCLALTACTSSLSDSQSQVTRGDFCKIQGSAIGHEGFVLRLGDRAVRFQDWVQKGSSGEYVGFSVMWQGTSSMPYVVKAATVRFPSSTSTWMHPDGQQGNAISNVDFCENCEDGDCDGDGDGGGDGGGGGGGECSCDENGENCTDGSEDGTLQ